MNSLSPLKPAKRVVSTRTLKSLDPLPCWFLEPQIEDHPSISTAATDIYQTQDDNVANVAFMTRNPSEKMDDELAYVTHHGDGTRKCCLNCNTQKNNSSYFCSNINSCKPKCDEMTADSEKSLLPINHTFDSLQTLQECQSIINNLYPPKPIESVPSTQPLNSLGPIPACLLEHQIECPPSVSTAATPNLPNFPSSLHLSASQETHLLKLPDASVGRHLEPAKNKVQPTEDCPKSSPINPKKRSYESVHAEEGTACKGCNCKKSECLKLYCECFSAGVYCSGPCACQGCLNKPINKGKVTEARKRIESRNPVAFHPKVVSNSQSKDDPNIPPAPTRHNKGCNCRKSNCQQKHCECYKSGVGCSISCRCEGCKNKFGRRSVSVLVEIRSEAEETEARENIVVENLAIQNIEEHPDLVLPTSLTHSQIITSGLHVGQFDEASQNIPDVTRNNT